MNSDLNRRADSVIERYNAKRAEYGRNHPTSKEVVTHDLIFAEVPNLAAKIDRAIGEFNDRASEASLRVAVNIDDGPHISLTIFKIFTIGIFEPELMLTLSVDNDGCVVSFISNKRDTERLNRISIFDISEAQIFEMILALVERELDLERF